MKTLTVTWNLLAAMAVTASAANVLFVSDFTTDQNIPAVLMADGHTVTTVINDFAGGNPTLLGSLSAFSCVVWSATGSGFGSVHSVTVTNNVQAYAMAGGGVFVTGYDSIASPDDPPLRALIGATSSTDVPGAPGAVLGPANSLNTGVVNIIGVTVSGGHTDRDQVNNPIGGAIGVVPTGTSTTAFQWTLRPVGSGEVAYVSNGTTGATGHVSWQTAGNAYNSGLRNFVFNCGAGCTIATPASPAAGDISLPVTPSSSTATVDLAWDFSLDAGTTWNPCLAAATSANPNPAIGVPIAVQNFLWDSLGDAVATLVVETGVLVRASVDDGVSPMPGTCLTMAFDVDNRPPPPSCLVSTPASPAIAQITFTVDLSSSIAGTLDSLVEFSTDAGATFSQATAAASSPLANPAVGALTGPTSFVWDSRADGLALLAPWPAVIVRFTLDDGGPQLGQCTTGPFDVDNTSLCVGMCGDCDMGGTGPNIMDAFAAAQFAADLFVPTSSQTGCCDVDSSSAITILDALQIAREASGQVVILVCP